MQQPTAPIDAIPTRPFPSAGAAQLYQMASQRLSHQLGQIDGLDQKIATLFGIGYAFVGIAAAFLALAEDGPPVSALVILFLGGAFWLVLCWSCYCGYSLRDWEVGPSLSEAWTYARQYDETKLTYWAAESFTNCYVNNQAFVRGKIFYARAAMILLTTEASAITIALGITAVS